jgi:hypothetical protein
MVKAPNLIGEEATTVKQSNAQTLITAEDALEQQGGRRDGRISGITHVVVNVVIVHTVRAGNVSSGVEDHGEPCLVYRLPDLLMTRVAEVDTAHVGTKL